MKLLDVVELVDNSPATLPPGVCSFLTHDNVLIGKITKDVVAVLKDERWLEVSATDQHVKVIDNEKLSEKFAQLVGRWRKEKRFQCLEGWRDELYSCYTKNGQKYFDIERSAACLFGLVTYGAHITGYFPLQKKLWVPRRSATKATYPLMLDNTVAGGLGNGAGFGETAVKECFEEAGFPPDFLAGKLRPAGAVTYEFIDPLTGYFQPEVEVVYDINMGDDPSKSLSPKVNDGEVEEFVLMDYAEVRERILNGEFKYNCALVLIDFFIRHGELTAENEADYIELTYRCHRRLPYPLRK